LIAIEYQWFDKKEVRDSRFRLSKKPNFYLYGELNPGSAIALHLTLDKVFNIS
jgi:hypothetical protein